MSLSLVFRPAAQAEFERDALWYESQRPGLGDQFVAEVQKVLDAITDQPPRYPFVFGEVREAPVRRFPYAVYYRIKPNHIVILAVFHCSRDPVIWQGRT